MLWSPVGLRYSRMPSRPFATARSKIFLLPTGGGGTGNVFLPGPTFVTDDLRYKSLLDFGQYDL